MTNSGLTRILIRVCANCIRLSLFNAEVKFLIYRLIIRNIHRLILKISLTLKKRFLQHNVVFFFVNTFWIMIICYTYA